MRRGEKKFGRGVDSGRGWVYDSRQAMGTGAEMTAVAQVKGKTEQRVEAVVSYLTRQTSPVGYGELRDATGSSYDSLLYILATLEEIGRVKRTTVSAGPGRPKVFFEWVM